MNWYFNIENHPENTTSQNVEIKQGILTYTQGFTTRSNYYDLQTYMVIEVGQKRLDTSFMLFNKTNSIFGIF